MAIACAFSRSILRSTSFRNAAARVTSEAKAKTSSPFRLSSNQKPLSHRIFKSPVELSCCVDSLMPFHSANSSAILISNLGVSLRAYGWLLQVDVERHARDFMEAAKKLQLYFIGLQHEEQPTKEEKLRKEIVVMEEELETKAELIKKHEKLIQGWRKELKDQLDKHVTELERV